MTFKNPNERKAYFATQRKANQPLAVLPRLPAMNNPLSSQKSQGMVRPQNPITTSAVSAPKAGILGALQAARNRMGGK